MNDFIEAYLNENNKLNGTNYTNWKFKLQTLLEGSSAWSIVIGDEQKPTVLVGGTTTLIHDWDKRENKVKVLLKISIKDNITPHIRDCISSNEIWTTLKNLYETQNTNHIVSLKGKLFYVRMEENESAARFITQIMDLKEKLGDIGEKVSDSYLVTITLNRMMDEYEMFITRLSARDKAPTFKELIIILVQEEERQQNLRPQSVVLALMVKKKPYKGKQPHGQKCGGVFQKRPFRETTYGANIYLGDDKGYEIRGYDDIPVVLPHGNMRYIKNVMYVLEIKKNLISISMMTTYDLQVEFFITYCVIKESKNERVASRVHVGGLYRLNLKSTTHQAMASTRLTTENLWHQRFGHLTLQDLMLLQRKGMADGLRAFQNVHLDCDGCALGKMHREEFPFNADRKESDILELMHTDICGPM
eukprot:PITA_21339